MHQQKVKKWPFKNTFYISSLPQVPHLFGRGMKGMVNGSWRRFFNLLIMPNWIVFPNNQWWVFHFVFQHIPKKSKGIWYTYLLHHIISQHDPFGYPIKPNNHPLSSELPVRLDFVDFVAPLPISFLSLWPCGTLSRNAWRFYGRSMEIW